MFQDAINVQQSILLEVWDDDAMTKDFLGECWLPPLETILSTPKDYVLPLHAPTDESHERGASRMVGWGMKTKKIWTMPETHLEAQGNRQKNSKITGEISVRLSWVYPRYELDNAGELVKRKAAETEDKEEESEEEDVKKGSMQERAMIQEKLHTGQLTVTLFKGRGLRRADAARGKDCDAFVRAWKRNDTNGEWRERSLWTSRTAANDKNPKWGTKANKFNDGQTFRSNIASGAFEERYEEELETVKDQVEDFFKTSKTIRREDEQREADALNRFGNQGLKLLFGANRDVSPDKPDAEKDSKASPEERAAPSMAPPEEKKGILSRIIGGEEEEEEEDPTLGSHHGIEVYMGDSIREFKAKITKACENEKLYWEKQGIAFDKKARKYGDVLVTYKHLVMIFVPTPKVQQLFAQGLAKGKEYAHQYNLALSDPSSWQPLEPTRTFRQYPMFHFDKAVPQQIRVMEATENYKLLNRRYKEFEEESNQVRFEDTNNEKLAYGFAKYIHKADDSVEWRPAMISERKLEEKDLAQLAPEDIPYGVEWCYKPFKGMHHIEDGAGNKKKTTKEVKEDPPEEHKANEVSLVPKVPMMQNNFNPAHAEVLVQAPILRQLGRSDWEIEAELNKSMLDMWASRNRKIRSKDKEAPLTPQPVKIRVETVRAWMAKHLREQEQSELGGKDEAVQGAQDTEKDKSTR
jgi:hypothetical protein